MEVFERRRVNLTEILKSVSAADLARKSGVAASYISRCTKPPLDSNHKTIGEVTARKLERGANKPEGWMDAYHATANITIPGITVTATGSNQAPALIGRAGRAIELIDLENNPDYPAIRRVNFKLSAGVSGFAIDYDHEDHVPIVFNRQWYESRGLRPDRLFAVKVANGSMEPGLHHGDTVVVNTEATHPTDGVVFAVNYEGELVIKRLVRDEGAWWLSSDNPNKAAYPRKRMTEDCFIIGTIVHKQSEWI